MTTADLRVDARDLKMLRESLCRAQAAVAHRSYDLDSRDRDVARISDLISEIDRHRPLRNDGKHANLHTPTCGCEDKEVGSRA